MSVLPTDFLESARAMISSQDEMAVRNAISRTYYAAYHQAQATFPSDREFARQCGMGVHMAYIEQLMQEQPGSKARTTAVKLNSMKGRRARADYDLNVDLSQRDFTMQLIAAQEVFKLLLSPEQPAEPAEPEAKQETGEQISTPTHPSRPQLRRIR